MSLTKRIHSELIHAYADGAEIECNETGAWVFYSSPHWRAEKYRIKPDCEYAYQKVLELSGDEALKVYEYWLDNGTIQHFEQGEWHDCHVTDDEMDNPFDYFVPFLKLDVPIRKKPIAVTQFLWVYHSPALDHRDNKTSRQWVTAGDEPETFGNTCKAQWHKVPTAIRQVEE